MDKTMENIFAMKALPYGADDIMRDWMNAQEVFGLLNKVAAGEATLEERERAYAGVVSALKLIPEKLLLGLKNFPEQCKQLVKAKKDKSIEWEISDEIVQWLDGMPAIECHKQQLVVSEDFVAWFKQMPLFERFEYDYMLEQAQKQLEDVRALIQKTMPNLLT